MSFLFHPKQWKVKVFFRSIYISYPVITSLVFRKAIEHQLLPLSDLCVSVSFRPFQIRFSWPNVLKCLLIFSTIHIGWGILPYMFPDLLLIGGVFMEIQSYLYIIFQTKYTEILPILSFLQLHCMTIDPVMYKSAINYADGYQ